MMVAGVASPLTAPLPCSMTQRARVALADAEGAIGDLRTATSAQWRWRWVGALAILRAVGHTLREDRDESDAMRQTIDDAWHAMQRDPIFAWLADERNTVLKTYEVRAQRNATVSIVRGFELQMLMAGETRDPAPDPIVSPTHSEVLLGGPFAGQDPADAADAVALWWHQQLDAIDAAARPLVNAEVR